MVKYKQEQLDAVFGSLEHAIRRDMLRRLARRSHTVSELAQKYDVSLPAISKHLKILEEAHLIVRRREGRQYHIAFDPRPVKTAMEHMQFYLKFWNQQLDSLKDYLEKEVTDNDE
ncbi:MAG: metalloregulator ArsR/SmtB family transcription factor [Candidatus Andersenbacteria bacterium]